MCFKRKNLTTKASKEELRTQGQSNDLVIRERCNFLRELSG